MTSLGNHGMCQALSTNSIHGLSTQNVRQINADKINNIEFNDSNINLQQINLDDKYKIDLSNSNFTITQTYTPPAQNVGHFTFGPSGDLLDVGIGSWGARCS